MEVVLTAAIGELTSRSISFLFDRYSRRSSVDFEERLQNLQRLLLRVCAVIEAAEGRRITSQAMLRQLDSMRKAMYLGYYTLDTFRDDQSRHGHPEEMIVDKDDNNNASRRQSFTLSKFNPAKRLLLSTHNEAQSTTARLQLQLPQALHLLSTVLADATEFILLLKTYPPLYRQPYSTYLFLDVSMFGRQMELERVISFLLQAEPQGTDSPDVLPIVGSYGVGKSTLVAHVCNDERVRGHFSRIVWFGEDDFSKDGVTTFMDGGILKHQQDNNGKDDTWLVVVSVPGDIDEVAWRRLYLASSATECANNGKIIITSTSNQVMNFGTTTPLLLNFLADEAYWYFFKALAFGSADPEEHPKLVAIAMKIAMVVKIAGAAGSFVRANLVTTVLRTNLNALFWSKVLAFVSDNYTPRNISTFYDKHLDKRWLSRHVRYHRMSGIEHCVFRNFRSSLPDEKIPSVKFIDILVGTAKCCVGRHEVLIWQGKLPPYKNYIMSCDIRQKPASRRHVNWTGVPEEHSFLVWDCK